MPKRVISGKVVKKAGDKTATVLVERRVLHPRYHKTLVHDERNEANVGDTVSAIELLSAVLYLKIKLSVFLKLHKEERANDSEFYKIKCC